jgi:hypothetical protein
MKAAFFFISTFMFLSLSGCASYDGRGLVPGQSMQSDVEASMGAPADVREMPNGETVLGPDGRLLAIEQRITEQNIARIVPGKTTADEVLDIVGPPYRSDPFPRMEREIWTYKIQTFPFPKALFVQISPDDIVREVYFMDDPEIPRLGAGRPG